MLKNNETSFSPHLLLMGDRFDDRVSQWFKDAIIIEHDLSDMKDGSKLPTLMRICSVTMGRKITKVTEVIGGSQKGLTLAQLSGVYPFAITQNSAYERKLLTRLVAMDSTAMEMNKLHCNYMSSLDELYRRAHAFEGEAVGKIGACQRSIFRQSKEVENLADDLVEQTFRKLLV